MAPESARIKAQERELEDALGQQGCGVRWEAFRPLRDAYERAGKEIPLGAVTQHVDGLTWYELPNGYTVSVLRCDAATWEAWAWPTALGTKAALTKMPQVFDGQADALSYRDEIADRERI